jgi:hypothetical protein
MCALSPTVKLIKDTLQTVLPYLMNYSVVCQMQRFGSADDHIYGRRWYTSWLDGSRRRKEPKIKLRLKEMMPE